MNKSIFIRLKVGLKKGYNTPILPKNIIKVQSYPIIRLIRFLGGLSFLLILSQSYLNYPKYILYFSMFFCLVFTIYHFIISYYRITHIIKILKSDQLDIRKYN